MKTRLSFSAIFFIVSVFLSLMIVGCGGNNNLVAGSPSPSPTPTVPPTPSPTPSSSITSVSMSCLAPTVPVGQANQCSATVQGTGNFNPAVSWSVNNIQGGNSIVGTVTATGLYTAPATVPTPFTVTIAATSLADSNKKGSAPAIVAGTIATVSNTITAAAGGTISLPDGSSVTIAAGILSGDQTVTLAEVSFLPNQPPNPAITSVGPSLSLSFSTPIEFTKARVKANGQSSVNGAATSSAAIQFSINVTSNNVPALSGSVPVANFLDAANNSTFTGVQGNFDSTTAVVTGSIGTDLLSGFKNRILAGIQFAAMNITNPTGLLPLIPGPVALGTNNGQPDWVSFSSCPTGRTLVLVHGMLSSIENAFPGSLAHSIQISGSYDNAVGFNYDWLQAIDTSGSKLASFLDTLSQCAGITIDIEAHSEGVPVSMAATTTTKAKITRMVSLGGPIMGTPAADDPRIFTQALLASATARIATPLGLLADVLHAPFLQGLKTDTLTPNVALDNIRSNLALLQNSQNGPQIVAVAGTSERLFGIDMSAAVTLMRTPNFDGIIPVTSALGFQSGLKVYPLTPFNLGHTELVENSAVIAAVGQQITGPPSVPFIACTTANCVGLQDTPFTFQGFGFNSVVGTIDIFRLDSTGAFGPLFPSIQDNAGSITWTITPPCSSPSGAFEIFSFDASSRLASNAVMQTVNAAACAPLSPSGTISRFAGSVNGTPGFSGATGLATDALLQTPTGVAFDGAGNMFVADFHNNAIRRVDALSGIITTVAGTGTPGFSGDGGPASAAQLNGPSHLAFDRAGNLYVTDANNNCVRKIILLTGRIATIAGTRVPGFSGDDGPAISAQLNFPDRLAADSANNLYVADFQNNRVRKINAITHLIHTVVGSSTAGFSGDGGAAVGAILNGPLSVFIDPNDVMYLADFNNQRIRAVNLSATIAIVAGITIQSGNIDTVAGNGLAGFTGDGGAAVTAALNGPTGLMVDSAGNLFFADSNNNVVRKVTLH